MTDIRAEPETASIEAEAGATEGSTGVGARELVVLISSIMALMAVGLDLILPGFDDIRDAFALGEGSNQVGQIITFYFFGLAVAQLVFGPLADRFGRKPVLYLGIGIYIVGAIASAIAPSFGLLLAARFLWGIGAAAARVVATAIVRDRFVGDQMARIMSQVMAVFVLVPVVAPTLGAGLLMIMPWQALFLFCALWAGGVAVWSLRLRETLRPEHRKPFSLGQAWRSYSEVARTPLARWYTLATVCLQAVFTLYLSTSELMISDTFDRGDQFPIVFGVVAIGFGIAAIVNGRLVERFGMSAMMRAALRGEFVLAPSLVGIALLGDGRPNFWLFMPLLAVALSLFMLLMPNLNTAAMVPLGHVAGSASALISAVRIGIGSIIAGLITSLIDDSVTPFAVTLLVMCVLAALFVRLGKQAEVATA